MATRIVTPELLRLCVEQIKTEKIEGPLSDLIDSLFKLSLDGWLNVALVSGDSFERLIHDKNKLYALESAGVDNWNGYTVAMELLEELNEEE